MSVKNTIKKPFYILMSQHGVPGAAVEVTDANVKSTIKDVKKLMKRDGITAEVLAEIQTNLAKELSKMMNDILRHGSAVNSNGDFYDHDAYNSDLLLCAVYDHIANGKQIAITDNIGPRPGEKLHE